MDDALCVYIVCANGYFMIRACPLKLLVAAATNRVNARDGTGRRVSMHTFLPYDVIAWGGWFSFGKVTLPFSTLYMYMYCT